MESHENMYGERPLVHRLLHPTQNFPFNLFQQRVPFSPYIRKKSKYHKMFFFIFISVFSVIAAFMFVVTLRFDVLYSFGVDRDNAMLNDCLSDNCTMPNVIQNVDGFAVPLYNLTIHRRYSHQISKYSYETWNFYYGNVSSEDFCQSESEELTLNCFRESFPNNSTGKVYYLTDYSPFLHNFTLGRDHLYLIDNQKYQFKLVSPQYYENTYRTSNMAAIFASIGVLVVFSIVIGVALLILKGKTVSEKLFGVYSLSREETELFHQNQAIVSSFHKRIVLQELYTAAYKGSYTPEDRALYNHINGRVETNGKIGEKERQLLATVLESADEEILSYEILSCNFTETTYGIPLLKWILSFFSILMMTLIPAFFISLVILIVYVILSVITLIPLSMMIYMVTCLGMKVSATDAHYILTNRQLIIIEGGIQMDVYCISLRDITNIWPRSVEWKGPEITKYRNELLVKLGNDAEYYNSGVLIVNVTNPQYYIETIQDLRQSSSEQ